MLRCRQKGACLSQPRLQPSLWPQLPETDAPSVTAGGDHHYRAHVASRRTSLWLLAPPRAAAGPRSFGAIIATACTSGNHRRRVRGRAWLARASLGRGLHLHLHLMGCQRRPRLPGRRRRPFPRKPLSSLVRQESGWSRQKKNSRDLDFFYRHRDLVGLDHVA